MDFSFLYNSRLDTDDAEITDKISANLQKFVNEYEKWINTLEKDIMPKFAPVSSNSW